MRRQLLTWVALALATVLVAASLYVGLAICALYLFALLFEPSGHPPLPAAPDGFYPIAFLGICPLLACGLSLWLVTWLRAKAQARAAQRRAG